MTTPETPWRVRDMLYHEYPFPNRDPRMRVPPKGYKPIDRLWAKKQDKDGEDEDYEQIDNKRYSP